jgi:hypothetical protein
MHPKNSAEKEGKKANLFDPCDPHPFATVAFHSGITY